MAVGTVLSGHAMTIAWNSKQWESDHTGLRQKQSLDNKTVGICASAVKQRVTGASDTILTVNVAVTTEMAANDFAVGGTGTLAWTYSTGMSFSTPGVIIDADLSYTDGNEVVGVLTIGATGAITHDATA